MAGHEWDDWFQREELIGQISDIRVQNLQAEREGIQKRTFTKWMNLHLEKCNPPLEITDLFNEIRDGRVLMALLEELSGCKLLHGFKPSSHRIFRLNNIAKVLNFLEERNVKLISIDAADVADGNSSLVLGLIWNIILFFQIKELTGTIQSRFSSTSSLSSLPNSTDSDTSHPGTPVEQKTPSHPRREHGKAIRTLLQWVQRRTAKYGVVVQDFGKSWVSGLAFLAVIKSIDSSLVDIRKARLGTPKQNLEDAFRIAHYSLGIPRLLEPEDLMISTPEEQSIMTYVSQFLEHFPGHSSDETAEATERGPLAASTGVQQDRVCINGVHREKPRPFMLRKDSVPPPPKIFISSVPDDVEQVSPAKVNVPKNSQPDKESCKELDKSPKRPVELGKEVVSVSPQLSSMDSAIDSPDSWSEMTSEAALLDSPGLLIDSPCPISPSEEKDWSQQNQATGVQPGSLRVFCTICGKEKMEEADSPQLHTVSEVCELTTAATPRKVRRSSVAAAPPGGMTRAELRLLLLLWLLLYCLLVLPQLDLRTLPHLLLNLEE
ncbi:calmin-like isoform X2 [Brienomyrus brachyistius]|uniref:calmin-like isoform X2 n=1 Tax=Brienomyrus brachyistius TaxID=42636 RepID=UPI0020B3696B|nr:calmin-like isoform X2 [Brienomyrus brachyistius]